jgi:hypothetical protein
MTVSGSTIFRTFVIPGAMWKRTTKISRKRCYGHTFKLLTKAASLIS